MIRIAIVEDDIESARKINGYINRYSEETNERFSVTIYSDGDEIASDYKPVHDIIFLDIEMKRFDGMSTAEYIRRFDKDVIIIFITNMAQFAIQGYSVGALDFLLKPVPYFAFSQLLKRSIEKVKLRKDKYILINVSNGIVKQCINSILYIESMRHKMIIHTPEKEYEIISTMKELEQKLKPYYFFRCNHCYLVNLTYITGIKDNCAVIGENTLLPISRSKKKAFLEALTEYVGGR